MTRYMYINITPQNNMHNAMNLFSLLVIVDPIDSPRPFKSKMVSWLVMVLLLLILLRTH